MAPTRSWSLTPKRKALMIFAFFVLAVVVIVNCANWYLFGSFHALLGSELNRYLTGVASLIGREIPWQTVSRFVPGDESGREYREIAQSLEELRKSFDLSDLTVLDPSNKTIFSLSAIKPIGSENPALLLDEKGLAAAWSGRTSTGHTVRIREGYLLTAFAPIKAPDGTVEAVVAVEADVNFFQVLDILQKLLYVVTILSILAIVTVALLTRRIIKHFLDTDEVLQRTDKLATVGRLAASVTHEIRNPLGIITTTAEVIKKRLSKAQVEPKLTELFDYILGEIDRLNGIITRFLEFARSSRIECERVTVNDLVGPSLALVAKDLGREGIEYRWNLGDGERTVEVDIAKIRQALLNCLLNAKDALKDSPRRILSVTSRIDDGSGRPVLVLAIRDSGPGIPDEVRDQIFEPFVTTKPQGSGLGLAVVRNVVEEHHGTVEVESHSDGACFTLHIPATKEDSQWRAS